MRQIGRGLCRKGRIAGIAGAVRTVTRRARGDPARRYAGVVDRRGFAIDIPGRRYVLGRVGQGGIVGRDILSRIPVQAVGNPFHLWVAARARGEVFQLPRSISRVEPGKARRTNTVAVSLDPVAGDASCSGSTCPAAERDEFAAGLERVARRRRAAGREPLKRRAGEQDSAGLHPSGQHAATMRGSLLRGGGVVLMLAAALTGCKPPPEGRYDFSTAAVERGRAVVAASGCAACHALPDVEWPKGRAGPSLVTFDGKGPIAGALPNTPGNLAAFVRNAPATKPGSPMPAMPISEREARDVAAYLYGIAE